MQDSLKTILYEAIKAKYPSYLTKFEAEDICKENGYNWADNGTSRLRELSRGEMPLVKRIKNEDRILVGYKWLKENVIEVPIIGTIDSKTKKITYNPLHKMMGKVNESTKSVMNAVAINLNEQLNDLEKKYGGPNAWNNAHIIKDIREARKSNDEYRKQGVIRKYS